MGNVYSFTCACKKNDIPNIKYYASKLTDQEDLADGINWLIQYRYWLTLMAVYPFCRLVGGRILNALPMTEFKAVIDKDPVAGYAISYPLDDDKLMYIINKVPQKTIDPALRHREASYIEKILEHKVDITPEHLRTAVIRGEQSIVRSFLSRITAIRTEDLNECLQIAVANGHKDLVFLLIDHIGYDRVNFSRLKTHCSLFDREMPALLTRIIENHHGLPGRAED